MKLGRHCNLMMSTEPTVVETDYYLSHVSREKKCVPVTYSKPGFGVNANPVWNGYSQAGVEGHDITSKLFSFCFSAVLSEVCFSARTQLFSFCFSAAFNTFQASQLLLFSIDTCRTVM